ncbi:STAS domain-containing protein [Streptomyces sp. NPDC026294]|uniref:STAS domain-containing protein n=1 Tax=Streptomyces sp. NPDC026294 TaxID=3155362 RepID=UPI0033CF7CED
MTHGKPWLLAETGRAVGTAVPEAVPVGRGAARSPRYPPRERTHQEVAMTTGASSIPMPTPPVTVTSVDDRRVVLTFRGELHAGTLRALETWFADPRLSEADAWVLEMHELAHIDLACAYALLRALSRRPDGASLTLRGARRTVARTLRHAGIDAIGVVEE